MPHEAVSLSLDLYKVKIEAFLLNNLKRESLKGGLWIK